MTKSREVHHCRLCRGVLSPVVLSLGNQPISNRLPRIGDNRTDAAVFPLDVVRCLTCGLVQLAHDLDPDEHFNDQYTYISGASSTWVQHCASYAQRLVERHGVAAPDYVIEVGSNDGTLLKAFRTVGIRGVGIEPSANVAALARADGIETVTAFFSRETAERVRAQHGRPRAVIGNNVLAHVPDPAAFLTAARDLIAPDGFLCFEFPHFVNILTRRYFDTIYHEHYTYLGVGPLLHWAGENAMELYAVEPQATHGGTLRVFLRHATGAATPAAVQGIAEDEQRYAGPQAWAELDRWLGVWREEFRRLLAGFKKDGLRVAGYAAASKATVIGNYLGLTSDDVVYCCDASPFKQGRMIPGTGIPILAPDAMRRDPPDVVIAFAWNIFDEIRRVVASIVDGPVTIVRPLPEIEVVDVAATRQD
jgi:SAM-dependent methyltransferase